MAVINPEIVPVAAGARRVLWANMQEGDTGYPVELTKYPDKTVQFYGTFGGTTATFQGSNDPRANPDDADHASAVWFDMKDINAVTISKTSNDAETIAQAPQWIRPVSTGGSGTSLNVSLLARKN